jgi:single-stranded-DNA-specific exonuclease
MELDLSRLRPVGEFDALQAAVELLRRHREDRIVIVGDFDADGATSTALMMLCLGDLNFPEVSFFVPDRFELGYGLTPEVVERVLDRDPKLLVTVDNGVTSVDGVRAARDAGIDVLITDHHLPGDELPDANAIVNPNLVGDPFAGKYLAGVGVAFYLLAALGRSFERPACVVEYLDLVALGTMADLVPLDHSNRILIGEGLRRIQAGRCRPGVRALCEVSSRRDSMLPAGSTTWPSACVASRAHPTRRPANSPRSWMSSIANDALSRKECEARRPNSSIRRN